MCSFLTDFTLSTMFYTGMRFCNGVKNIEDFFITVLYTQVSVLYKDGKWEVVEGDLLDFSSEVVAVANLTYAQNETGWNYLEVASNEEQDDEKQAIGDAG